MHLLQFFIIDLIMCELIV